MFYFITDSAFFTMKQLDYHTSALGQVPKDRTFIPRLESDRSAERCFTLDLTIDHVISYFNTGHWGAFIQKRGLSTVKSILEI
jgi:hypothetical protein